MIPNIFSLLGESIVGKHIAKGIIFSNSPKKFHPNGSRIQVNFKRQDIFLLNIPAKAFDVRKPLINGGAFITAFFTQPFEKGGYVLLAKV